MSRRTQTIIFLAVLAVVGFFVFDYVNSHDSSDSDSKCRSIFVEHNKCYAEQAAARMRGGY